MLQACGVGMADAVLRLAGIHLASLTSQIFKTVLAVTVLWPWRLQSNSRMLAWSLSPCRVYGELQMRLNA